MSKYFDVEEVQELIKQAKSGMAAEQQLFQDLNGLSLQNPFGKGLVFDLGSAISKVYKKVYKHSKIYLLDPSTLLLFDSYFAKHLGHCLTKLLKPWIRSPKRILYALDMLPTDALICLRLAMKMNEN